MSERIIELRSDNTAGAAPEIVEAIAAANGGSARAYGDDEWTERLQAVVREVFEHDGARVFPVASGTAANSLTLSAMCPPWGAVLCHESSHIVVNECGATSLFGGGAVMTTLPGAGARLHRDTLAAALDAAGWGDNHVSQPSVLELTQPTDYGTVYRPGELADLVAVAAGRGLRVHVDGTRLANAVAALGCRPAELTSGAGIAALSLGAIKNGGVSTDAIVSFDDAVSAELYYRLKRAGHVSSKMRFQSAQLLAYLDDGLWLRTAARANAAMARLAKGLRELAGAGADVELVDEPEVNLAFIRLPEPAIDRLEGSGVLFYRIAPGVIRFVTSFETTDDDVDEAIDRLRQSL